jgi:hypothetical protein
MTEDQLRVLVREIVEERLSISVGRVPPKRQPGSVGRVPPEADPPALSSPSAGERQHSSHQRLRVEAGVDAGGPCLIEPAVRCNLCGYCQSLGH